MALSGRPDLSATAKPQSAAAPPIGRATGTDTVTIACALPQGVWLCLYHAETITKFDTYGREVKENQSTEHGRWFVRGVVDRSALAATGTGDALPDDYRLIRGTAPGTGYALTYGVPRDHWEAWERANADSPLIKNRLIFAESSENRAVGHAKELKDIKSGFQGLDPGGDYRVSRRAIRKFDRNDNSVAPDDANG